MPFYKSKIFINVFSSGAQVIFTGLVYFFLYRLLLVRLNVELLGVWSIVLSTSSLANLANFGISSSVTRFVSSFSKNGEGEKINELIFTSALFLFGLFFMLSLLIFPFAELILKGIIEEKYLSEAIAILPFSIICLILNAVGGVYSSVLEGLQRNYVKNIILSISSLILLGGAYLLTSASTGLKGVAYAQMIQSAFGILAFAFFAIKFHPHNPFKWRWSKTIFKEIFSYGTKFQLISISAMLNDPLTKILLAKFGGLQFTGYYEMANRLVSQFRGVIVNANQSLIPVIVSLEDQKERARELYKKTFVLVYIISGVTLTSILLMSSSISIIWISEKQLLFISSLALLCLGYFANLLCGPAYFSELSSGKLNLLLKTHLILSLINAFCGALLGYFFGGSGVILGWVIALVFGSLYLIIGHHKKQELKINLLNDKIIKSTSLIIIIFISIQIATTSLFHYTNPLHYIYAETVLMILFMASLIFFITKDFKNILLNKTVTPYNSILN